MTATVEVQKQALNAAAQFKKDATAGRLAMERKIRELGDKVDFWVDKDKRMAAIRRKEAKELEDGQKTMEASKSQAQIAWHEHEQVSNQLKTVQAELAEAKGALEKEKQRFTFHRREDSNILLQMNHGSLDIVKEFRDLGVSSPPIIIPPTSIATPGSCSTWPRSSRASERRLAGPLAWPESRRQDR